MAFDQSPSAFPHGSTTTKTVLQGSDILAKHFPCSWITAASSNDGAVALSVFTAAAAFSSMALASAAVPCANAVVESVKIAADATAIISPRAKMPAGILE
jgi:hypothetical protein